MILKRNSLWCQRWEDAKITGKLTVYNVTLTRCLAGIPRRFKFSHQISDIGEVHYEVFSLALKVSGVYKLHGFGKYEGIHLKFADELDEVLGLTPIWKKVCTENDPQFLIFFDSKSYRWELHEKKSPCSQLTYDHLFCKTGLFRLSN